MKAKSLKRKATVSEDTVWYCNSRLPPVGAAKEHKTEMFEMTTLIVQH